MIERKVFEERIDGRDVTITVDHHLDNDGYVVSSVDGNHVLHLIGKTTWLLRDGAAINGELAVVTPEGISPLSAEERGRPIAWYLDYADEPATTREGAPFVAQSAPDPGFKVGEVEGEPVTFSDVASSESVAGEPYDEPPPPCARDVETGSLGEPGETYEGAQSNLD